ncbi:MAG: hypothetical protein II721_03905, partial [Bacilli bacterium]|nr:hypothetical protein [Bacilli bacterium]
MRKPVLDQDFAPAIIALRQFNEDVAKTPNKQHLIVAVERANGYIYRREFDIFPDGVDDARNALITERLIKSILWIIGGFKIYIAGSHPVYLAIKDYYRTGGLREFDYDFWSTTFEREVEVVECALDTIPQEVACSESAGGHLDGKRIGFDFGAEVLVVHLVAVLTLGLVDLFHEFDLSLALDLDGFVGSFQGAEHFLFAHFLAFAFHHADVFHGGGHH